MSWPHEHRHQRTSASSVPRPGLVWRARDRAVRRREGSGGPVRRRDEAPVRRPAGHHRSAPGAHLGAGSPRVTVVVGRRHLLDRRALRVRVASAGPGGRPRHLTGAVNPGPRNTSPAPRTEGTLQAGGRSCRARPATAHRSTSRATRHRKNPEWPAHPEAGGSADRGSAAAGSSTPNVTAIRERCHGGSHQVRATCSRIWCATRRSDIFPL